MKIYSLLFLSVILINGIFHCPNAHAERLSHASHDQSECVFLGDNNCPESSEIAVSKKRFLEIDADVSVETRREFKTFVSILAITLILLHIYN